MSAILEDWQVDKVCPGGVFIAHHEGKTVVCQPFGHIEPKGKKVTQDTVYDIASLTKAVGPTAILMVLVSRGEISLDDRVCRYIPELRAPHKQTITFRHLVGHASGLPAHQLLAPRIAKGEWMGAKNPREAILRLAASAELVYSPGTKSLYSDLGFIILGFALERITGNRLDTLVKLFVTDPLQMNATRFGDLEAQPDGISGVAPTQPNMPTQPSQPSGARGVIAGQVHDDNAFAAGGICGHAGLFSTAGDIATFGTALIEAANGAKIAEFSPDVVNLFFTTSAAPNTSWRLGWDTPAPPPAASSTGWESHAGDHWPKTGIGHLGYTGCSIWLDPPREWVAVLLTNRVYVSHDPARIRKLRRNVMNRVVALFEDRECDEIASQTNSDDAIESL